MSWALPLPVAIPLLAAAILVIAGHVAPRRLQDAVAVTAAAAATVCSALVLAASENHDVLHWFGGWHPRAGVAVGIDFAADPLGAGMAALATGLVLLVLLYSWTYMRSESQTVNVLFLTFGAGMAGFSLTGDIFNMFVWFELMGVSAYALAGFKVEELGPLQGAVNFAITNTVGAYMILAGIALLYARTGALNLAQIGTTLRHGPADSLVVIAFALILTGLMVKAAIVPFHFWLADAHAASPAPVCALLSGAMVELGIFFIARVYWTVFAAPLHGHAGAVRDLLVGLGAATALVGAGMCLLQRHIKRLLAYSTIAHAGIMLTGVALLDPRSLAGVADLVLAHGLLKAGLFLTSGIVLLELRHVDELRLYGAGRRMPFVAVLWFAATLGLAGLPGAGVFLGHQLLDEGAREGGYGWLAAVGMVATGLSTGAMLRAGARIFLGWGARRDELLTPEPDESAPERAGNVAPLVAVSAVATALGLAVTLAPGLGQRTQAAAARFVNSTAYAARILHGLHAPAAPPPAFSLTAVDATSALYGLGTLALALIAAALGLWHSRLPRPLREAAARVLRPGIELMRDAHSGIVGDYLLWLATGSVVIAGVWAYSL